MLEATRKIYESISNNYKTQQLQPLINNVIHNGKDDDIEVMLKLFINYKNKEVLFPLMYLGDKTIADKIFKEAIKNGKLKDTFPSRTLLALSYLNHPDLLAILINYYINGFSLSWELHENVCFSLLNYPCLDFQNEIKYIIQKCLNCNLFPDYLPLPVIKLQDTQYLNKLKSHALIASPACTGGILLAKSFYAESEKISFKESILFPNWGCPFYYEDKIPLIVMAMHNLQIGVAELYWDNILRLKNQQIYFKENLLTLISVLKFKVSETIRYPILNFKKCKETFTSVYDVIFEPNADNQNMTIFDYLTKYFKSEHLLGEFLPMILEIKGIYQLKIQQENNGII